MMTSVIQLVLCPPLWPLLTGSPNLLEKIFSKRDSALHSGFPPSPLQGSALTLLTVRSPEAPPPSSPPLVTPAQLSTLGSEPASLPRAVPLLYIRGTRDLFFILFSFFIKVVRAHGLESNGSYRVY